MSDEPDFNKETEELLEATADNPGARTAAIRSNPKIGLEEARNANEGKGPNAMGGGAPNPDEDKVSSTSSPHGADLPNPHIPYPDGVGDDDPGNTNK